MGTLQVVDVNGNRVIDEISFYEGKISYATGLGEDIFNSTKGALKKTDEGTFHYLNGWSNGYLRIIPKPGTHPELEAETASLSAVEERLIERLGRLERQAGRAVDKFRRAQFNRVRSNDALWFMRAEGAAGGAVSAEGPDA